MGWDGMAWYGMVWYGMVWYGMVWYGMVWYDMVCPPVIVGESTGMCVNMREYMFLGSIVTSDTMVCPLVLIVAGLLRHPTSDR